jgi:hypothetical protein
MLPYLPRTNVLGYSQPSLRDWFAFWVVSRLPSDWFALSFLPRTNVLGYSQPSLRDWFAFWVVSRPFRLVRVVIPTQD